MNIFVVFLRFSSRLVVTSIFVVTSLLHIGCPDEKPPIVIPPTPTNCEYPAGNRNFNWRLDTVAWWPSTLGGVHAFSDTDAWVMGYMQGPTVPGQESYVGIHWNGKEWKEKIDFLTILMKPNDVTGDDHFMVGAGWVGLPEGTTAAVAEFNNQTKLWKGTHLSTKGELRCVWTDGGGYFIAAGDTGMVYIKDGYLGEWIYHKAPTNFSFYKVSGISKNELYLLGNINISGNNFKQLYRFDGSLWKKLSDTQDTSSQIIPLTLADFPTDVSPFRCEITDSLSMFIIGNESYLLQTSGKGFTNYKMTNLESMGLPLRINGRTGIDANGFSPSDVWIFGTRYNFYHWNGINFLKVTIPGLPNDDLTFGDQRKMIKTSSGKLFLPTEISSQVYVVIQGTPK